MYIRLLLMMLMFSTYASAQNPVIWKFSAKKMDEKTFELHLSAKLSSPWHIYSQHTPEGGPVPAKITLAKNPLITVNGKAKEIGKLQTRHEEVFGVDVEYFDGEVDFVQIITLKSKVKTNVSGNVEYMVCNDQQCLPPTTVLFNIPIQ